MRFEWEARKNAINIAKHGIDFRGAVRVFEGPILAEQDGRKDYGETRWRGLGLLSGRLVMIAWTLRGEAYRLISVRKANGREVKRYEARYSPGG